jgi:hypothetical protein
MLRLRTFTKLKSGFNYKLNPRFLCDKPVIPDNLKSKSKLHNFTITFYQANISLIKLTTGTFSLIGLTIIFDLVINQPLISSYLAFIVLYFVYKDHF